MSVHPSSVWNKISIFIEGHFFLSLVKATGGLPIDQERLTLQRLFAGQVG